MKGSKYKKGFRESIDDVLDDLLGKDDASPSKTASPVTKSGGNLKTSSRTSRKSLLDDDFFNKLAQDVNKDNEESEISDADPQALLETMKDIDDMDADLFGKRKKLHSIPSVSTGKTAGMESSSLESTRNAHKSGAAKDNVVGEDEEYRSAPLTSKHQYKKFTFEDIDDPLAGILTDEEDEPKKPKKVVVSGQKRSPLKFDLQPQKEEKGIDKWCPDENV